MEQLDLQKFENQVRHLLSRLEEELSRPNPFKTAEGAAPVAVSFDTIAEAINHRRPGLIEIALTAMHVDI
jgi:hypothetical protein